MLDLWDDGTWDVATALWACYYSLGDLVLFHVVTQMFSAAPVNKAEVSVVEGGEAL